MSRSMLAAALCAAFGCAPAAAATFTVTRLDDPSPNGCLANDCSLREAVVAAEATSASDTIMLGAGKHVLRMAGLATPVTATITRPVAFVGAGRDATQIAGLGFGSLFAVSNTFASFRALTLQEGRASKASVGGLVGGALRATGSTISFDAARLSGNSAEQGGALHVVDGSLDLSATLVEKNSASKYGGGIFASAAPVRLRAATTISGNVTDGNGGGIDTDDEVNGDDDCAITGNQANRGGGIAGHAGEFITVAGTATPGGDGLFEISDNIATGLEPMWTLPNGSGGGIHSYNGLAAARLAVLDNTSDNLGGGITSHIGSFQLRDSYVAHNAASNGGGGFYAKSHESFVVERVGIDGNSANYGAAMVIDSSLYGAEPARATLRNLDVYGNGGGTHNVFYNSAHTALTHATFLFNFNDSGASVVEQSTNGSLTYRNSVLLGRCTGSVALISAGGVNLRSFETSNACLGDLVTQPLEFSRGLFGGRFEITGTTNASSGIVDAASTQYCLSRDVRNRVRPAACDLGAFEYGAQ